MPAAAAAETGRGSDNKSIRMYDSSSLAGGEDRGKAREKKKKKRKIERGRTAIAAARLSARRARGRTVPAGWKVGFKGDRLVVRRSGALSRGSPTVLARERRLFLAKSPASLLTSQNWSDRSRYARPQKRGRVKYIGRAFLPVPPTDCAAIRCSFSSPVA